MRSPLNGGTSAWVVMAFTLFLIPAPMVYAQEITPSDVEQYMRASFAAYNSADIIRIAELDPQVGFGYRTKAPRAHSPQRVGIGLIHAS